MSKKTTLATVWLDGCSGCHMSFLDMDDRLLLLAEKVDLVYSPLVDAKVYPELVDVALVEGGIATDADEAKIKKVREHTKFLIVMGDCGITANVPGMRNTLKVDELLKDLYLNPALVNPQIPTQGLPKLLPQVRPVHTAVKVDLFIPGCPPGADTFFYALSELLEGRIPDLSQMTRFGV